MSWVVQWVLDNVFYIDLIIDVVHHLSKVTHIRTGVQNNLAQQDNSRRQSATHAVQHGLCCVLLACCVAVALFM